MCTKLPCLVRRCPGMKGCVPWCVWSLPFDPWGQVPPGLIAVSGEVNLKERSLLKSTLMHWDLLAPSSSLKILLSDIKDKIYKHESSYYGLITGLVVVTLGNPSGVLTRAE